MEMTLGSLAFASWERIFHSYGPDKPYGNYIGILSGWRIKLNGFGQCLRFSFYHGTVSIWLCKYRMLGNGITTCKYPL